MIERLRLGSTMALVGPYAISIHLVIGLEPGSLRECGCGQRQNCNCRHGDRRQGFHGRSLSSIESGENLQDRQHRITASPQRKVIFGPSAKTFGTTNMFSEEWTPGAPAHSSNSKLHCLMIP